MLIINVQAKYEGRMDIVISKYKELEITYYTDEFGDMYYKMSDVLMFIDSERYKHMYDWINKEFANEMIQLTKPDMEAKEIYNGKGMRAIFMTRKAFAAVIREYCTDLEKLSWTNEIFFKKKTSSESRAYSNICDLHSSIASILASYDSLRQKQSEIDSELCDLEHEIESFNIINSFYALDKINRIRTLRQERRHIKNDLELITPFYNYLNTTNVKVGILAKLKVEADAVRQRQINWYYRKRI